MKYTVEGVKKGEEYNVFKTRLKAISMGVEVSFKKNTVHINYLEPYTVTEATMLDKSRVKKEILKEISVLRQIQFMTND